MEDLVKMILSFGYTIIVLAVISIILSAGEVLYSPLSLLLIFSIVVGIIMIVVAILLAKGKVGFIFIKDIHGEQE